MDLRSKSPCRARISEGTAMGQVLFGDFFPPRVRSTGEMAPMILAAML